MTTRFDFKTSTSAAQFYDAATHDKGSLYFLIAQAGNAVAIVCTTSEAVERCKSVFVPVATMLGGTAVETTACVTI
jgi:hypothetical protein